jgi:hypothetical protein
MAAFSLSTPWGESEFLVAYQLTQDGRPMHKASLMMPMQLDSGIRGIFKSGFAGAYFHAGR